MDNFIVEEYVIYSIKKDLKRHYILKKYDNEKISITRLTGNSKEEINLNDIESEFERKLIEKYVMKLTGAKLRYAAGYIYSLLSRKYVITLKEYGDVSQIKNFTYDGTIYKIVRYYFNAKGRLFKKMFDMN